MRRSIRFALYMAWPLAVISAALTAGCAHMDDNFRAVKDGDFYRSAQMRGDRLGEAIRDHGIGTVVNLRGASDEDWYKEEVAVCKAYNVDHIDFKWSMRKLPDPESMAAYMDVLENAKRPILVHCQGGIHRAGTASAIYVLDEGGTPDDARDQFGLYFHHAPIGDLVTLYEGSPLPFGEWVKSDYAAAYETWTAEREAEKEQE